jgi:hypothetical protein
VTVAQLEVSIRKHVTSEGNELAGTISFFSAEYVFLFKFIIDVTEKNLQRLNPSSLSTRSGGGGGTQQIKIRNKKQAMANRR